jgi:3-phenylpropionate/cinnamic acid dioxygenase small subunit
LEGEVSVTTETPSVRDEIENLFFRYARGFDENDLGQLAECFTEDAKLYSGEWIHGREEIRARLSERRQMRADDGQLPRHVNSNIAIEPRGPDELGVYSYFSLLVTSREAIWIDVAGTYEDTIVRQDGRWLIASRRIKRDELA